PALTPCGKEVESRRCHHQEAAMINKVIGTFNLLFYGLIAPAVMDRPLGGAATATLLAADRREPAMAPCTKEVKAAMINKVFGTFNLLFYGLIAPAVMDRLLGGAALAALLAADRREPAMAPRAREEGSSRCHHQESSYVKQGHWHRNLLFYRLIAPAVMDRPLGGTAPATLQAAGKRDRAAAIIRKAALINKVIGTFNSLFYGLIAPAVMDQPALTPCGKEVESRRCHHQEAAMINKVIGTFNLLFYGLIAPAVMDQPALTPCGKEVESRRCHHQEAAMINKVIGTFNLLFYGLIAPAVMDRLLGGAALAALLAADRREPAMAPRAREEGSSRCHHQESSYVKQGHWHRNLLFYGILAPAVMDRPLGGTAPATLLAAGKRDRAAAIIRKAAMINKHRLLWTVHSAALLLPLYWLLKDESPRWLHAQSKWDHAAAIIKKAAMINKKPINEELMKALDQESKKEETVKSNAWLQLLRSKVLIFRFLTCCWCWIAVAFVYYGLTINSVALSGDKYVNFALNMAMEVVASLLIMMALERFGRKWSIFVAFLVCGAACVTPFFVCEYNLVKRNSANQSFTLIYITILYYTVYALALINTNRAVVA
ncbi:hypothetical protein evm_015527, partial [Chilo suppressalis]